MHKDFDRYRQILFLCYNWFITFDWEEVMEEFFGFGGYERPAEGFLSWQHLLFVTCVVIMMIIWAVVLGKRNKHEPFEKKNRVLRIAAIVLDGAEIFRIIIVCLRSGEIEDVLWNLPLFLCSIQLISVPLAAFSKGRVKEAALDFVSIFGMLGAILGTYCAGNNYAVYPVLSFDNVFSAITHTVAGFAALYIMISGMASMKRRNIWITVVIFLGFCIAAYWANVLIGGNYMFLVRGDGTPYDIVYNWVSGNKVLYPLLVTVLTLSYLALFYVCYFGIRKLITSKKQPQRV